MQGGYLSYGLLGALAIALLYGAYTDLKRRQIGNRLNAAIALAAPLYWWASGMSLGQAGWQIGLALVVFAVTALLFFIRQMGGGDVKLLTALALWITPGTFLHLCIIMAFTGSTLSILAGIRNMEQRPGERLRHGLALGAAGLWVLFCVYALYVIAGGRPLPIAASLAAITGPQLAPWLLLPLGAALMGSAAFGTLHILRRQKRRLPIPYGLAISVAGLWLIAAGQVPATHSAGSTTGLVQAAAG